MILAFLMTLAGVMAAQLAPGPNLVAVASVALAQGRRAAIAVVAGISAGMLVWSVGTALGLGAVLTAFPLSLVLLKMLGGGYLLYLGARAVLSTWRGSAKTFSVAPLTGASGVRRGVLVVLTNPKAALMWAAVATFLFGQGLSPAEVLLFGPVGALSGFLIYGGYGVLFSTGLAMRTYGRFARWIEGVFAASFGAMGAGLLWSGLRDLRS